MAVRITHERLLELVHYSLVSGKFYWKIDRGFNGNKAKAGTEVGSFDPSKGSLILGLDGKTYAAGRIAFFYLHGFWPVDLIDHRNRDPLCNAWVNLREANRLQNRANGLRPSGHLPGVTKISGSSKFQAQIQTSERKKYLGSFVTQEEAHEAYKKAHVLEFKEFSPYYKA